MATITMRVEGSTVGTVEKSFELTGTDSDRILTNLMRLYGTAEDGTPRTPAAACGLAMLGVINGWKASALLEERAAAEASARAGVNDITVTEIGAA
ncbi:hypothetical protein [Acuticoccus sediminis]|uniref:hypothetical protein n=1 Tax=Acuticoccus sediminis TaxID=2184697 RepID=UPI001CFCC59F|nr:hypothetical protein [Acuticoccus sediminis]